MNVWIQHRASETLLRAQRDLLDMRPESQRYWTGDKWSPDPAEAMLFDDTRIAKEYRETARLSEKVPSEWQTSEVDKNEGSTPINERAATP
jgi:hypothetical protein